MAGGLYLLPFAGGTGGDTHYWRLDYKFQGRRKTLSLGSHPQVTLAMARERASEARAVLAGGLDPTNERRSTRVAQVQAAQVISSEAPLGRAMLGKCEGDEVSIQVALIRQQFEVLRVY